MRRLTNPRRACAITAAALLLLACGSSAALVAGAAAAAPPASGPSYPEKDWAFLDNGQVRLGVKKGSGAAIGFLAPTGKPNLLNHFDHGRLVQQSYYGDADGSLWNGKPWRWNPVQGGDWKGRPATVLELRAERDRIHARTRPRHWASGEDLADVTMEQEVTLRGKLVHVRYRMTYAGTRRHKPAHQEVPAVFVEPRLATLVLYDGERPWTGDKLKRLRPGWPNEMHKLAENWAAYVGEDDVGVGAYVPVARALTCYRFKGGGGSDCSYFAPIVTFAVEPGLVFEYDLYLTVGTSDEIRKTFAGVHAARPPATGPAKPGE